MRWLTADEGGRERPHPGGRYAATAFPESGTTADLRSIVFDDVPPGPGAGPGEGAVTARWLASADGPGPGTNLIITEGPRPAAILEIQRTAPAVERPWSFRVTDSFTITGRGAVADGALSGRISDDRQPAELHTREHTAIPVTVSLEFARVEGGERPMLLVYGIDKDQLPPGAVLRPRIDPPGPVRLRRRLAHVGANLSAFDKEGAEPNFKGLCDVMPLAVSERVGGGQ